MPGGDGTGPLGFGAMTGRRAGFCAGYSVPGYANPIGGRGFFGGRGRGWRNMYYATGLPGWARYNSVYPAWEREVYPSAQSQITTEQELDMLKKEAKYMQNDIKRVNDRINELENQVAKEEK